MKTLYRCLRAAFSLLHFVCSVLPKIPNHRHSETLSVSTDSHYASINKGIIVAQQMSECSCTSLQFQILCFQYKERTRRMPVISLKITTYPASCNCYNISIFCSYATEKHCQISVEGNICNLSPHQRTCILGNYLIHGE